MKILVVYYSMYGHILQMARAVAAGAEAVDGAEVMLRRVEEFPAVRDKIQASLHGRLVEEQQKDIPVCTMEDLEAADGIIFGTPTRYGNMTAQMKALFDATVGLWARGALEGKPAGVFTSSATTHGGQETTLLTMLVPILHLGMIIVGVPYSTPGMLHSEARGGTPYGASTIAGGRNELSPAPEDLNIARALGRRVAEVTRKLRG
jgi:NAD(P)H dehydrogenase (quinone)